MTSDETAKSDAAASTQVQSLAVSPMAAAAAIRCSAGYVYSVSETGQLREIQSGGAVKDIGTTPTGVDNFNGLGIGLGGAPVIAYERDTITQGDTSQERARIYTYNVSTGVWSSTGKTADQPSGAAFIAGAVDLKTGLYYFGGYTDGGKQFRIFKYDPAANAISFVGAVDTSTNSGGTANGDMAFDGEGTLYIVRGSGAQTTVFSVVAADLAAANGGTINSSGSKSFSTNSNVNGVAFDASGKAYLGTGSTITSYDMPAWTNGKVLETGSKLSSSTDLASCSSPMSISLEKNVVARVNSGDQFALSLSADGTQLGSATTSGTKTGVQDQRVGPYPTRRSVTVNFSEAKAGTTVMTNYASTWACYVDGSSTPYGSGPGTSGSIAIPTTGNSMICRFLNTPLTGKVTITKRMQDADGKNEAVRSGWTVGASTQATSGSIASTPTASTQTTGSNGSAVWNLTFGQSTGKATVNVSETQQTGYEFVSGTCVINRMDGSKMTTTLQNESSTALTGVVPGDDVQCTYVNKVSKAKLTLIKKVTNDNGGTAGPADFTLNANGPTPITGKTGTAAVTQAPVNAGDYTLSESGGPTGYTPSAWDCTGGTLSGSKLTLAAGGSATCTITNDDQPGKLTLRKVVNNTHGGTATAGDFTLTAKSGSKTISGKMGEAAVTGASVDAGSYTLGETGGPVGYKQQGNWDCGSATVADGKVVVANGATVTCTVTNVDQPATLTLKKNVDNTNGGNAAPSAFTLKATGPTNVSGAGNSTDVTGKSVNAGTYTLAESGGPAGYAQQGAWVCDSNVSVSADSKITVANGANVTCTVTNASQPGTVTWTKTDEAGHALKGSEWNLKGPGSSGATVAATDCVENSADKCTGPDKDPAAGKFNVTGLQWGNYTLTETKAPAGYLMDSTARTITIDGNHLTVNVGPITNKQAPGVNLPLTGGTGSDAFLIGGGVLLAGGAAAGGLLFWRRKQQN